MPTKTSKAILGSLLIALPDISCARKTFWRGLWPLSPSQSFNPVLASQCAQWKWLIPDVLHGSLQGLPEIDCNSSWLFQFSFCLNLRFLIRLGLRQLFSPPGGTQGSGGQNTPVRPGCVCMSLALLLYWGKWRWKSEGFQEGSRSGETRRCSVDLSAREPPWLGD